MRTPETLKPIAVKSAAILAALGSLTSACSGSDRGVAEPDPEVSVTSPRSGGDIDKEDSPEPITSPTIFKQIEPFPEGNIDIINSIERDKNGNPVGVEGVDYFTVVRQNGEEIEVSPLKDSSDINEQAESVLGLIACVFSEANGEVQIANGTLNLVYSDNPEYQNEQPVSATGPEGWHVLPLTKFEYVIDESGSKPTVVDLTIEYPTGPGAFGG